MKKNWIQRRLKRGEKWYLKVFQLNQEIEFIGQHYRTSVVTFIFRRGQWCLRTPWNHHLTQQEIESCLEIIKELNSKVPKEIV